LLAQHFLEKFAEKNKKHIKGFNPRALDRLIRYDWPGNIRELMNAVERAVVLSRSEYLDTSDLPSVLQDPSEEKSSPEILLSDMKLEDVEKIAILNTLEKTGGNKSETARRLGITRKTLHKKLKTYNVM
jgi:two-component system response regulator HydG